MNAFWKNLFNFQGSYYHPDYWRHNVDMFFCIMDLTIFCFIRFFEVPANIWLDVMVYKKLIDYDRNQLNHSLLTFICSKSTIETLEKGVTYVPS